MKSDALLPKFDRPPVVETILGVQFEPLPGFRNTHLGLFWSTLDEEWKHVTDAAALPPQFERFEREIAWEKAGFQLSFSTDVALREQVRNSANDRMIQFQNGRLHLNWLGEAGGEYPSYGTVRPEFDRKVELFKAFIASNALGEFRPNQWEVTYVNHIPKGSVWNSPDDWGNVFRCLVATPGDPAGASPESFTGEWQYEITPGRGRLHIQLKSGWRKTPKDEEILLLVFTARGPVNNAGDGAIDLGDGLDLGHETIVRAFADLTTEKAQQFWGRSDANH